MTVRWHRITWKGPGALACLRCYRPAKTLWYDDGCMVYDPKTKMRYVLMKLCAKCKKQEEARK